MNPRSRRRVLLQQDERNDGQGALMRRGQDDGGGDVAFEEFEPARSADAPAIARLQTGKLVLGPRGGEVVADLAALFEKLVGHLDANRVAADVLLAGVAMAVAEEAGARGEGAQ